MLNAISWYVIFSSIFIPMVVICLYSIACYANYLCRGRLNVPSLESVFEVLQEWGGTNNFRNTIISIFIIGYPVLLGYMTILSIKSEINLLQVLIITTDNIKYIIGDFWIILPILSIHPWLQLVIDSIFRLKDKLDKLDKLD